MNVQAMRRFDPAEFAPQCAAYFPKTHRFPALVDSARTGMLSNGRLTLGLMGSFGPLVRPHAFAPMVRATASVMGETRPMGRRTRKGRKPFGGFRHTAELGEATWRALEWDAERKAQERRERARLERRAERMLALLLTLMATLATLTAYGLCM